MAEFELDVEPLKAAFKLAEKRLAENIPVALALGADIVAAHARVRHDGYVNQTGELSGSIMADEVQGSFASGDMTATVAAGAAHGIFVHDGTKPHVIKPKQRKALRWEVEGGFAFAKEVHHPGTDATNFLANAVEEKLPEVAAVIEDAAALSFEEAGFEVE